MKETLILITAALRLDNLIDVGKSINLHYDKYKDNFNIIWIICKDQYNGYGNIDSCIDYLNTTNIDYIIKDSGLPNQKNYGGDLFNIPLQEVIAERNLDDAWIYVMDDDNVLHPNLFYTFNKIINNHNIDAIYGGIILTKKSISGHVHEMYYHSICHPSTDNNIISIFNIPDPSQCILRYSFIKNNGFIPGEVNYDYKWFISNIRNYKDQFIYYNDYNGWFSDMINAYHNNLRHLEDIEKYIDDFNYKETYIDVTIQNEDTHPLNFPILKKETQEKILELIKEDLLNR